MESLPKYEDENRKVFDKYVELFQLTKEDLAKPILDVGAGNGEFIHFLRHELNNSHAFGVEENSRKVNSGEDGMIIADGFELPFSDESFEIVVSKDFLPMFTSSVEKSEDIFNELIRVTKSGGRIIGNIYTPETVIEESNQDIYKGDLKFQEAFNEMYKGSVGFKIFLEGLEEKGYSIDYNKFDYRIVITLKKP